MIDFTLYRQVGELAEKYKDYENVYNPDDPMNREALICKNMRLAVDLAVKYATKYSLDEEDLDDLVGEGLLGLSVSYDKYKPDKEGFEGKRAKFSSVAFFWVNAALMSAVKKILDRRTKHTELVEDIGEPHQRDIGKVELLYKDIGEIDVYLTRLRFGIETGHQMTYRDISKHTGFRVSLIKKSVANCIAKMKENAEVYGIKFSDVFA